MMRFACSPAIALGLLCLVGIRVQSADSHPNVLLICVDDLRPELKCFGAEYIHSPNIDELARSSRLFGRHYVQAPTCGASRYAMLTGCYGGASNEAIADRAKTIAVGDSVPDSMPEWFRQHGYTTVSVGKVSHYPGGRMGPDWDDDAKLEMPDSWDRHLLPAGPWQHPRGSMHGLAHGEIRNDPGAMDVMQSVDGDDSIYPDGLIVDESLRQLDQLASDNEKPFFLAVGIIRPHLPFGAPAKYMLPYEDVELPTIPHPMKPSGTTTWHGSGEFMRYNRWGRDPNTDPEFADEVRRHYAACVTYADASVGRVLSKLRETGADANTVVVLWGDHGWHLGEHAIWGKHALFEESLRSPLLVRLPSMPDPGKTADAIIESVDIFPTLCDASGIPSPNNLDGSSLMSILDDPASAGDYAISYTKKARTLRDNQYRLTVHDNGAEELYDHSTDEAETLNLASQRADVVKEMRKRLDDRLPRKVRSRR
ncbi:Arylsulfatase [Rubripirellula tenax]|uniref:Arylsulfatase n=2 Tax=Rubripirellula tenax TaxID=2528015 RepID=A0A5C6EIJ8_9BACT|nr:Arylsulfatase [Rubripirellula tenax]